MTQKTLFIDERTIGQTAALAKWIAHPKNPLTARSIVNRVWQRHFGKPLRGTRTISEPRGKKPTHPELLDWLAADFVKHGWKFKRLHKQIMLSDTYRLSTSHPEMEKLRNEDPENHLLAYRFPRRLTAEELRDGMLVSTGELNRQVGGLPVMPEINMEVALQPRMIQFSLAPAYQPSVKPKQRNRRTLYAYRVRGQPDPFLELFNQPNPNDSCEERVSESVTPQAFSLLNSDFMNDRSMAWPSVRRRNSKSQNASQEGGPIVFWASSREVRKGQVGKPRKKMGNITSSISPRSPPTRPPSPVPSSRKPPVCLSSTRKSYPLFKTTMPTRKLMKSAPIPGPSRTCVWFFSTPTNLCTLIDNEDALLRSRPQSSRFPLYGLTSSLELWP